MTANLRYRAQTQFALAWKTWNDEEYVIYHEGSGDTHLLNALAAEALGELGRRALDVEELAAHFSTCLSRPLDDELRRAAEEMIRKFDELGLIESAA